MPLPKIDDLFNRNRRGRFLNFLDIPHLLICILIIGFYVMLLASGRLERAENNTLDFFFRQKALREAHPSIVLIEIDKESLDSIGAWPWPWSYHAQLLKALKDWKVRSVIFDFYFKDAATPQEAEIIQQSEQGGPLVYLPVALEPKGGKKIWVHGMPIVIEPENEKKGWTHSLPQIEKEARDLGHRNLKQDADGIIRRVDPYQSYAGESYFYLPIKAGYDYLGEPVRSLFDLKLPVDAKGNLMIHWSGRWQDSFRRIPYADLVRSLQALEKGLKPVVDPASLKDKICIIGLTSPESADLKVSPLDAAIPVMGIHANVLNNVLKQTFLAPAPMAVNSFCLCLLGFVGSILFVVFGSVASFIAALLMAAAWFAFSFFVFVEKNIWIYSLHPVFLILTLFIFSALYDQIRSRNERVKLFDLATRDGLTGLFVIRHFREVLNRSVQESREQKQPLSVILMDIDNFKKVNDTYGHPAGDMVLKKSAEVIHRCFRSKRPAHMVDFAARYGGEEFIIMLRNASLKDSSLHVAERIRKAIEGTTFEWEGTVIPITMSLGVATMKPSENIPDLMVRRADEALYRAKKTGKNRVCIETFAGG